MSDTRWLSLRSLKLHEFHQTLRLVFPGEENWHARRSLLAKKEKQLLRGTLQSFAALFIIFGILSTLDQLGRVGFELGDFSIKLPAVLVMFAGAISLAFSVIRLQALLMIIGYRARHSSRIKIPTYSSSSHDFMLDEDNINISFPTHFLIFWKSESYLRTFLEIGIILITFSLLLGPIAFGIYLFEVGLELASNSVKLVWERALILGSIFIIFFSAVYMPLFNTPVPIQINRSAMRWNFLWWISKDFPHPQIETWKQKK